MFSVQSVLGFILGFAAAVFVLILGAPIIWRRALFLAQKVVRTELPLSLKEVEADRDFLRARQAIIVCRLQEELAKEQQEDYARKQALSQAREQLQHIEAMTARDKAQQAELEKRDKRIAGLEEEYRQLQSEAEQDLQLKRADLAQFRQQIQKIAAQTAGLVLAEEGENSPALRLVAAAGEEEPAYGAAGRNKKTVTGGTSLAAAIYARARQVLAARRAKPGKGDRSKAGAGLGPQRMAAKAAGKKRAAAAKENAGAG